MNTNTNILPNLMFISMAIVVPACFMAIASVGVESDILRVLSW